MRGALGFLLSATSAFQRQHISMTAAIQAGHFAVVAMHFDVIDLECIKSRHDMFDHVDHGWAIDQSRAQGHVDAMIGDSLYARLIGQIGAHELHAGTNRSRL